MCVFSGQYVASQRQPKSPAILLFVWNQPNMGSLAQNKTQTVNILISIIIFMLLWDLFYCDGRMFTFCVTG